MKPPSSSGVGWDGGTNGERFDDFTKNSPAMTNSSATPSLTATATWLTRLESLIPPISTPVSARTSSPAGRFIAPSVVFAIDAGISSAVPSSTFAR